MAECDCRIVAMLSVAVSLLLLGSVILIRFYHHNRHSESPPLPSEALVEGHDEFSSTPAPFSPTNSSFHISDVCLQCICQVETGCKPKICAGGASCGTFRFHQSYWVDAGKPTKDGTPNAAGNSHSEYLACVNSPECATRTLSAYVSAYSRDCNEDGMIDCADYLLIHHFGPSGCMLNENLRPEFMLERCLRGSSE